MRGYSADECVAIGDSREDLRVATTVGSFWFVANALERDPQLAEAMAGHDNVRVAEESHGAGVYEAILSTLRGA
jgi:hydroxymethylpyrimidine pyrophosphatase-like HAD family hydrolase